MLDWFLLKDYPYFCNKMRKFRYILLFAACLMLWQCNPEPVPEPEPPEPDPAISIIGPSAINLSEEAGEGTITFISATGWAASTAESWISINPSSGDGSKDVVTMTITCEENPNETPRTGEITITSGDIAKIITVSQAGQPSGPKSEECELSVLRLFASSNPSLAKNIEVVPYSIRGIRMVLITFPENTDVTNLIPVFEISKKAKVMVSGGQITNGKSAVDFSHMMTWTVVAEDGEHTTDYVVIPRKGDIAIDNAVYAFMGAYNIPGVGIAVIKNDHIAYSAGYGMAEVSATDPVLCTEDHLFRLASVSKTLTAICILTLCQKGQLSLEEKLFAPGGCLADIAPSHLAAANEIRIVDLLTHRSGWTNNTIGADPIFTGDSRFYGKSVRGRLEYMLKNIAPYYTPGTYYSYFNMGFSILGLVIEQITGKSYETYLREVAAKAGANDIWLSKTPRNGKRENECVFYSQDSAYPYDNNMEIAAACGGVTASATDMARILCAIDYGSETPDLLTAGWLNKMYTNYTSSGKGGYGLGWWIGHNAYPNWAAYHTGSLSGTATLWVRGNDGTGGVILCNSRSQKNAFDGAMYEALNNALIRVKQDY